MKITSFGPGLAGMEFVAVRHISESLSSVFRLPHDGRHADDTDPNVFAQIIPRIHLILPLNEKKISRTVHGLPLNGEKIPRTVHGLPSNGEKMPRNPRILLLNGKKIPRNPRILLPNGEKISRIPWDLPSNGEKISRIPRDLPLNGEKIPRIPLDLPTNGEKIPRIPWDLSPNREKMPRIYLILSLNGEKMSRMGQNVGRKNQPQPVSRVPSGTRCDGHHMPYLTARDINVAGNVSTDILSRPGQRNLYM
jgi:hypothetical protein